MITIEHIQKSFDQSMIINDLTMSIDKGSIYGLIGPNGSGKTTIMNMIAGVYRQDSGTIAYDGENIYENSRIKGKIGYIPDLYYVPNGYSLKDLGKFYKGLYKDWNEERFIEMVKVFQLDVNKKMKSFSKGMKKQAYFCLVMSTMPEFLLLDEPIDGLDPIVRKLVYKYIFDDVAERNMGVLISSHNLKELEGLCDKIGIIFHGHMSLETDLDTIKHSLYKIQVSLKDDISLEPLNIVYKEKRGSLQLMVIKNTYEEIEEVIEPLEPVLFDVLPLTLEEIFIYELGGEDDDIKQLIF